jgi:hypothetical protein
MRAKSPAEGRVSLFIGKVKFIIVMMIVRPHHFYQAYSGGMALPWYLALGLCSYTIPWATSFFFPILP